MPDFLLGAGVTAVNVKTDKLPALKELTVHTFKPFYSPHTTTHLSTIS